MKGNGVVTSIHISGVEGGELRPLTEAEIVAGRGMKGDRYYLKEDKDPGQELTLVEAEQVEQFNTQTGLSIAPHETRRNIVTRGIALNELVGVDFMVGEAEVRGIELCEPCKYMAGILASRYSIPSHSIPGIVAGLAHRAGLRVKILGSGTVRVGDSIGKRDD